jgi:ketosteroid isomerase-like protein
MTDVKQAFERLEAAFAARDMEGLIACWSPDIVYRSPAGTITGIDQRIIAERIWLEAFPDAETVREREYVAGNVLILEGSMRGTHTGPFNTPDGSIPPSGRVIEGRYVSVMTFEDGKVTDQSVYFDRLALMAQLGALPS